MLTHLASSIFRALNMSWALWYNIYFMSKYKFDIYKKICSNIFNATIQMSKGNIVFNTNE